MTQPLLESATVDEILAHAREWFMPTYANAPTVLVSGRGPWLKAADGAEYLDFAAGVAVSALGHDHPDLAACLKAQAERLIHQSNYWHNEHAAPLAASLGKRVMACGGPKMRVFFANSGAEANEAAVKVVRRYHALVRGQPRPGIVTAHQSFHGRTYAAMSATGQPRYQEGFEPLVPGFRHVAFGDLAAFDEALGPEVGAVLIEVVQGEGGVRLPAPGFFRALRRLCDERGVLLVLDEIQTGLGRTGSWFAFEQEGIEPDVMTLAKGLGGGVPIGAMLAREEVAAALTPGSHATTFGANALATAAARTVLAVMERDGLVERAASLGRVLLGALHARLDGKPWLRAIRGRGLLVGVELAGDAKKVMAACRVEGLLLTMAGPNVVRLTPPLIVEEAHCLRAAERLAQAATGALGP